MQSRKYNVKWHDGWMSRSNPWAHSAFANQWKHDGRTEVPDIDIGEVYIDYDGDEWTRIK